MSLMRNNTIIEMSVHVNNDFYGGNEEEKSDEDSVKSEEDRVAYEDSLAEIDVTGQSNQAYIESDDEEDDGQNKRKFYSPTGSCELESCEEDLKEENADEDSDEVIHGLSRVYDGAEDLAAQLKENDLDGKKPNDFNAKLPARQSDWLDDLI